MFVDTDDDFIISIHAPTRGATRCRPDLSAMLPPISIHAPTRGATPPAAYAAIGCSKFQSTLPREERPPPTMRLLPLIPFQSTLPREEQLHCSSPLSCSCYFNPRSHERSDSNIAQKICLFLYNTDNKYIIR